MTPEKLTRVLHFLKVAEGKAGLVRSVWNAARGGSEAAAKALESQGHNISGTAVRYSPHLAVGYGAKKAYESEPAQKLRYRYQLWKYNRAQRRAMEGQ